MTDSLIIPFPYFYFLFFKLNSIGTLPLLSFTHCPQLRLLSLTHTHTLSLSHSFSLTLSPFLSPNERTCYLTSTNTHMSTSTTTSTPLFVQQSEPEAKQLLRTNQSRLSQNFVLVKKKSSVGQKNNYSSGGNQSLGFSCVTSGSVLASKWPRSLQTR